MLSTVTVALEQFRSIWERNVKVIAAKLTWLSPMTVTLLTLPFGILAAWLMATADTTVTGGWTLIAAGLTVGFCQLLDGLDGTLARATNRVTRFGDLLDQHRRRRNFPQACRTRKHHQTGQARGETLATCGSWRRNGIGRFARVADKPGNELRYRVS